MITHYLNSLKSLSLKELLEVLNDTSNNNKLLRTLVTSTILVHKYLQYYSKELYSVDLALSTILTIVQSRMLGSHEYEIRDIDNIVKRELNILSNITYNGVTNHYIEDSYSVNPILTTLLKEAKKEILSSTPEELKLAMAVFLNTNMITIHGYSKLNKNLFKNILEINGYEMDTIIDTNLISRLTISEKALFLYLLSTKHPEIFIILTSVKDINTLMLLSEYKSIKLPEPADLIVILETISVLATKIVNDNKLTASELKLFGLIANQIKLDFSGTSSIGSLLNKSIDKLYKEFDETIDTVASRAKTSSSMTQLMGVLHTEVNNQINIVTRLRELQS